MGDAGGVVTRDALFRWLAAGRVLDPHTATTAPAARWDLLSRRAGVVGGGTEWPERIGRHLDNTRAFATTEPADEGERLVAFVELLERDLHPPAESSWRAWSGWAVDLVERYVGVTEDPRDVEARVGVLDALRSVAVLDLAGTAPTIEQFTRTVSEALDVPAGRVGRFGAGVFVGSTADLRGCRFAVVYVLGMAEGRYPPRGMEDPLLDDADRAATHGSVPLQRDRVRLASAPITCTRSVRHRSACSRSPAPTSASNARIAPRRCCSRPWARVPASRSGPRRSSTSTCRGAPTSRPSVRRSTAPCSVRCRSAKRWCVSSTRGAAAGSIPPATRHCSGVR